MKREILFRGKAINSNKWIESMTISNGKINRKENNVYLEIGENKWVGVIPETVSQFIGLLDKNGKKIFEGDILRGLDGTIGCVLFEHGAFTFSVDKKPITDFENFSSPDLWAELIGNIYDSPELLNQK